MRLLLVDDDPLVGKAIRRLLAGHHVTIALTGIDALALYEPGMDAALIDLQLTGGMDGLDVAGFLRGKDREFHIVIMGGDLPIVLPYPHIDKPFTAAELRIALEPGRR
jgi:CheY-like chemotaxis protein